MRLINRYKYENTALFNSFLELVGSYVYSIEEGWQQDSIFKQLQQDNEDTYIYYADKNLNEVIETYLENGYSKQDFISYLVGQYQGFDIYYCYKYDLHYIVSTCEFYFDLECA